MLESKKVVIIIGSGFSFALTGTAAPMIGHGRLSTLATLTGDVRDWLEAILASPVAGPTSIRPPQLLQATLDTLKRYENKRDFEQLLSAMATKAALAPPSLDAAYRQGAITTPAILNTVIWAMCSMFSERLALVPGTEVNRNFWYYVTDQARVRAMRTGIRSLVDHVDLQITALSFNYDGIFEAFLDTDFGTKGRPNFRYLPHVGHCVPIRPIENAFDPAWSARPSAALKSPITVLKPHGSLHFHRTRADYDGGQFIGITHPRLDLDFDPANMQRDIPRVPIWNFVESVPMIVPPVFSKDGYFQTEYFRSVMSAAAGALADADVVISLGFSIPPSDYHLSAALDDVDWTDKKVGVVFRSGGTDMTLSNWEGLVGRTIDNAWSDGLPVGNASSISDFWTELLHFCTL